MFFFGRRYINPAGEHILLANKDTNSEVEILLQQPIVASRVRIHPFSYHARTVCLRVGLTGCKFKGGKLQRKDLSMTSL